MKYTTDITIDLPRARVVELFDDPDNLKKWQKGLQSFEPLSGTPGQPGATSRLVYEQSGRTIEMIETVTSRNLPDEFSGTYEAKGVYNVVSNRLYEDGPNRTRLVTENEFHFSGLMALIAPFMSGTFKKQMLTLMQDFKKFAESEGMASSGGFS